MRKQLPGFRSIIAQKDYTYIYVQVSILITDINRIMLNGTTSVLKNTVLCTEKIIKYNNITTSDQPTHRVSG